jgi:membrane associated rhomboid family serine protease
MNTGRFVPVLGVFAAGLVYTVLPHGAFGPHDVAARAAIVGTVAAVATGLMFLRTRRRTAR